MKVIPHSQKAKEIFKALSQTKHTGIFLTVLFFSAALINLSRVTAQSSAVFLRLDTTTQGNWKNVYGSNGYNVINDATSYPSYAQVSASGQVAWTWASSTNNVRALQKASGNGRIAATWFSNSDFTIDINFTDGLMHQVALYCLDWDSNARAQTVEIRNAATNALLDTRNVSNFNGGVYLVWNLSGHVLLRLTRTAGANAVMSGLFFAPPANSPPTVSITAPANGAIFPAPSNITINATAADTDGTVSKVEFFRGNTKLGEDLTAPYSFPWNNVAAGSYSLTAKATDNGGATTTSSSVNITVTASNVPPTVSITSPANGATFPAPGNITINATAADTDGTVAKVEFFQGATKLGEDLTAPYSFAWNNVAAGSYALTARALDNGGATTTSSAVNVTVTSSNAPPTVSITSPTNGTSFPAPANITINATAADTDGTVTKVEFFQGVTKLGEDLNAPYSFVWNNVSPGSYTLTAIATDNNNAATTSNSVNINVASSNAPPTVSITSPANGATFPAPANITINATAADTDGTVAKVEFFQGATKLGEDLTAPYSFAWNNVSAGSYALTARALDNGGATTTSSAVNVTVTSSNTPPTVSITSPTNGTSFFAPATITINATAADTDGNITKVEFFRGTTKLGEDTNAPYSFRWNNVLAGNYDLTAVATDNGQATTTSSVVNITVQSPDNSPPTVSITAPNDGASFTAPANITINAAAADTDGTVTKVEFFQGATKLGEDLGSPFTFSWNNVPPGSYTLLAKATDNGLATTTSSGINITVIGTTPTVSFVRVDATTQGNWRNVYGTEGYQVINHATSYPSYAQVTSSGHVAWTWETSSTDLRALQKTVGTDRIAATWFSNSSFTININLTDGLPHQVALYSLDWDSGGVRAQTVEVLNTATGQVLDTRTLTVFNEGRYLVWNISGNVTLRITRTQGDNAVVSGLFFSPVNVNALPSVSLTAPANGATFTAPANINLTALAGDSDGGIERVEFYAGTTLIGTDTAHPYTMVWNNVAAGNYALTAKAYDLQGANNTSSPVNLTITGGSDPRPTVGEWSAVATWPCVAIHLHVLPNGKVLFWQSDPAQEGVPGTTATFVWDTVGNTFSQYNNLNTNLFCSGHSFLSDGRLLVASGHIATDVGEQHTNIFNFSTNTWTQGPDLNAGRWYPTNCALPNGETIILSGTIDTTTFNTLPQVYQTNGTLRSLTNAILELPFYPWLHVAPNGQVFVAGPDRTTRYLNTTGTGAWTTVGDYNFEHHREYGAGVMYEPGKVMIAGGGNPPTNTVEVIDLNAATPTWRNVSPMASPRRNMTATQLPDGTVLVTGGSSSMNNDASGAVLTPEMWHPATETWTTMASMPTRRLYHSTAALLPDGRVVTAGGGFPAAQGDIDHTSAEFYSPPYLFKGARPAITTAPANVTYGQLFNVTTPDAAGIAQVTLVGLSSVTHANNMGQRFNRLSFTAAAGQLNVTAPANRNLCPPGYYMLFILNGAGVPSVAKIVRIN